MLINRLRSIFARFGIPHTLVCDNAPEFIHHEFKNWLNKVGCKLLHSPEYRPQSNGLAERMVGTVKSVIKCYNPSKCSINEYLDRMLFVHRNTARRGEKTPSEWMIGRNVRCPILGEFASMQQVYYKANRRAPAALLMSKPPPVPPRKHLIHK